MLAGKTSNTAAPRLEKIPTPAKPKTSDEMVAVGRAQIAARGQLRKGFERWVRDFCPFSLASTYNYIARAQEAEVTAFTAAIKRFTPTVLLRGMPVAS